jgi:hypothetical protein
MEIKDSKYAARRLIGGIYPRDFSFMSQRGAGKDE